MKATGVCVFTFTMAVAVHLLMAGSSVVSAADIKSVKEWTGQVADANLEKEWPNTTVITNKEDFEKLWKSWRGEEAVPEIDFTKELVFVSTQKKGQISDLKLIQPFGKKDGEFVSTGSIDAKLVKGFTYALTVFKRDGIKSINGKPLK